MRYPHVARLRYRLETTDETSRFVDPSPVERQAEAFYMRLDKNVVWFSMREHHGTEASARERVERYLRGWEVSVALQYGGRPEIHFVFEDAETPFWTLILLHLLLLAVRKPWRYRLWRLVHPVPLLRRTSLAGATPSLPMISI